MDSKIVNLLKNGGVGVIPTDTIYGLVSSALNPQAVETVYRIKKRTPAKPFITLISSLEDLALFNIDPEKKVRKFLQQSWPNPLSVILPCLQEEFSYLHRGTNTLAFRVPKDNNLLNFLSRTGPLIAPSANPEGRFPATTIKEARNYFGKKVDFYIDGGKRVSEPSTLIQIEGTRIKVLREGAFKLNTVDVS